MMIVKTLLVLTLGSIATFGERSPIVIVPGLQGSQLWGTVSNLWCHASSEPRLLWWSIMDTVCIPDLEMQFDQTAGTFADKSGVTVSVPGFGDTSTVECLDDSTVACDVFKSAFLYFKTFVDFFVSKGYVRGHDIRAAPYDWRLAANSAKRSNYFDQLKGLIEETYTMHNKRPITLVVHSMGGPMSLYFLNQVVTPAWKSQYIAAYVTLSGAFAGATKTLGTLAVGISPIGIFGKYLRGVERSMQSLYWLSPDPAVFGTQPQVKTPARTYTAADYQALYTNFLNYPVGWQKYQTTVGINDYSFPQVPTYCFYGSNVETQETYVYSSNDPSTTPTILNGPGDGTVNKVSLEVCLNWRYIIDRPNTNFNWRAFNGVDHEGMLTETEVLKAVAEIAIPTTAGQLLVGQNTNKRPTMDGKRMSGEL